MDSYLTSDFRNWLLRKDKLHNSTFIMKARNKYVRNLTRGIPKPEKQNLNGVMETVFLAKAPF